MEEYLSCYGGNDVGEGATVLDGVCVATATVRDGVRVRLGVQEAVADGVSDAVSVMDGVNVAGWKGVHVTEAVVVSLGVSVTVDVLLAVLVSVGGVGVSVAVPVTVGVGVSVRIVLPGAGARAMAINPIQ